MSVKEKPRKRADMSHTENKSKMVDINLNVTIIEPNVNGLKSPSKSKDYQTRSKRKTQLYAFCKRQMKRYTKVENKMMKKRMRELEWWYEYYK